ncbi:ATP-binding protein [Lacihabitans sp. LS3-19]|uniref:AlbA family DNA-binding domain-containing protein n=1 Tax=Lacihabitans sp. LS3-19 TaxID=2487335 RepID=UPI0020CEC928|nr:ATP-binding protein [Lacihabitans sp. LS3-19]MCP9767961.1 ATP-binding protein [Lacihabitans sp. LS3-19]
MDLKTLKLLVRQGEGQQLEFKLKSNHPDKIMKEIVAFANSDGGLLILGVADNKELIGLKYADEDEYIITKNIEKYIFPPIAYNLERIRLENEKEVLIYKILESNIKPHYLDLTGIAEERKVYVRNADKSIQASKEVREILKGQNKPKGYKFAYGEKENKLLKYLDLNEKITVSKFAEIAEINKKVASRTLILLVLTNVLKAEPREIEDVFVINNEPRMKI